MVLKQSQHLIDSLYNYIKTFNAAVIIPFDVEEALNININVVYAFLEYLSQHNDLVTKVSGCFVKIVECPDCLESTKPTKLSDYVILNTKYDGLLIYGICNYCGELWVYSEDSGWEIVPTDI